MENQAGYERLSETARAAVRELVILLAAGFTGSIELDCNQGGVRNFRETRNRNAAALERIAQDGSPL